MVNCMWMAVARGEFERGRRLHYGGVGGKDAVPQSNKVNDASAVYAGGATDFTRRWDGGGGGEWAGRNDEVDEDR